jgi:UDPglucose 6-dehydrogenase
VTGAVLADLGHAVVCVDEQTDKIEMLRAGRMPIYEPGLEELVCRNAGDGRLSFTTDLARAVRESTVVFITVGTPGAADGRTSLAAVEAVARVIAGAMERYTVVVNKSTVPVGTAEFVRDVIERYLPSPVPFDVVSNPEFLREGRAIEDTLRPARIVIGAGSRQAAMTVLELYAALERPIMLTDVCSAEMIKYASNAFLATKISFANAVADLCELTGADVRHVMKGVGLDARIGSEFLCAGLGYGGSCFPKDARSLIETGAALGYDFALLRAVVDINQQRARHFVALIDKALAPLDEKVVSVLGLAFKPDTDDLREAKSLEIVADLIRRGATVRVYDPVAMPAARAVLPPSVVYCNSAYDAADGADAIALVTEWNEFRLLDLARLRGRLRRPLVFDGRQCWDPERMRRLGFEYHAMGRTPVMPT